MPFCIGALLAAELPSLPEPVVTEVRGHFADLAGFLTEVIDTGLRNGELASQQGAANEAQILIASVHGAILAARVADGDATLYANITHPILQRLIT
jgi:TetR/AcrR family transcriptional repressor of nem operon